MYTTKENTPNAANDIKGSANNIKNEARDTLYDVKEDLHDVAARTGRRVRGLVDSASGEITHASEVVGTQIRSNPVQSSLIALGVGFIIGTLFRKL